MTIITDKAFSISLKDGSDPVSLFARAALVNDGYLVFFDANGEQIAAFTPDTWTNFFHVEGVKRSDE